MFCSFNFLQPESKQKLSVTCYHWSGDIWCCRDQFLIDWVEFNVPVTMMAHIYCDEPYSSWYKLVVKNWSHYIRHGTLKIVAVTLTFGPRPPALLGIYFTEGTVCFIDCLGKMEHHVWGKMTIFGYILAVAMATIMDTWKTMVPIESPCWITYI